MYLRESLLFFIFLVQGVWGGFIQGHSLQKLNSTVVSLEPLVIFVAIDADKKLMKFLINTRVMHPKNESTISPIITDVDYKTNRFTTLHVELEFMGKTFVKEDLRFCDVLAVKNTSSYEDTYRFDGLESTSSSSTQTAHATGFTNPDLTGQRPYKDNSTSGKPFGNVRKRYTEILASNLTAYNDTSLSTSLANSNASVEALFSNSTGNLIQCPLYVNDSIALYYQADVSANFQRFGSYSVSFTIVSNNENSDVIGGAVGYVTSSAGREGLEDLLFYGVLGITVCAFVLNFMIIIFSPDQESDNPFLIEASAICNEQLLRQLESHPNALLSYLQFALFMSGLNVLYPGFFQYLMGRIKWCALMSINIFHKVTSIPSSEQDNVYMTYFSGLRALAQYSSNGFNHYSWPNFIVCLLIWAASSMAAYQLYITVKHLASTTKHPAFLSSYFGNSNNGTTSVANRETPPRSFRHSLSVNLSAMLGHFLRVCLCTFGFPFLVLTIYMLYATSRMGGFHGFATNLTEENAFSSTIPYWLLNPYHVNCAYHPLKTRDVKFDEKDFHVPVWNMAFGSILLAAWLIAALSFVYYYISPVSVQFHKKHNVSKLYTSVKSIVTWGYLYNAYKPSKVYYVAVDIFACIFSSIVIAALQDYGAVQVSLMIVCEFARLGALFTIRPYFLKMTWYSLPVLASVSRFLVTILNIPYVSSLKVAEANRSYVAYAQMIIHCIVALAYVVQLLYCLVITIVALLKSRKKLSTTDKDDVGKDLDTNSLGAFEFKQVAMSRANLLSPNSDDAQSSHGSSLGPDEVDYYRSRSEQILRSMERSETRFDRKDSQLAEIESASEFEQAEERIRQQDYTTREADRIFQKYFSADEMDPEMKALWDARDWSNNVRPLSARATGCNSQKGFLAKMWEGALPSKKERGFEVMRRKPIIVTLPAVASSDDDEKGESPSPV